MSDLQVVGKNSSGEATLGMVSKQCLTADIRCIADRRGDHVSNLDAICDSSAPLGMVPLEDGEVYPPLAEAAEASSLVAAAANGDQIPWPDDRLDKWSGDHVITAILTTTDAGSDEASCRRMLQTMFARRPTVW
eukprot:2303075-Pyramimonas_sp.AAC.1